MDSVQNGDRPDHRAENAGMSHNEHSVELRQRRGDSALAPHAMTALDRQPDSLQTERAWAGFLESAKGRPPKRHVWCVARAAPGADGAEHGKHHAPRHPAKRALAALENPPPDVPAGPQKRISAKVRRAIDAMVSGKCKRICDAAEHVGLARESLSRALSTPHVAQHLREKVLRHLAIAAARAGYVKGELLDSDNDIARDRASSFILGLAGIQPATSPSLNINLEVKAGYVIDLTDDRPPPMRVIPHE